MNVFFVIIRSRTPEDRVGHDGALCSSPARVSRQISSWGSGFLVLRVPGAGVAAALPWGARTGSAEEVLWSLTRAGAGPGAHTLFLHPGRVWQFGLGLPSIPPLSAQGLLSKSRTRTATSAGQHRLPLPQEPAHIPKEGALSARGDLLPEQFVAN